MSFCSSNHPRSEMIGHLINLPAFAIRLDAIIRVSCAFLVYGFTFVPVSSQSDPVAIAGLSLAPPSRCCNRMGTTQGTLVNENDSHFYYQLDLQIRSFYHLGPADYVGVSGVSMSVLVRRAREAHGLLIVCTQSPYSYNSGDPCIIRDHGFFLCHLMLLSTSFQRLDLFDRVTWNLKYRASDWRRSWH